MRYFLLFLSLISSITFALGNDCGDCEIHFANLTNIAFINATTGFGQNIGPHDGCGSVNISYCGCPDLNNTVIANAEDQFGHVLGPKVVYQKVNLTYFAGLDITKVPSLVTNMTEVGPDLVLVEYNITVTNIGQVNVTGIYVYDPRLGNYSLGKLLPGENTSIDPDPYYIVTPDDVKYCSIDNMAVVNGTDRCCKGVNAATYASLPLAAKNLETYLKIYSFELIEYGYELNEGGDAEDLEDYEEMIRVQANRLMVLREAMEGDVTSCVPPPVYNSSEYNFSSCTACPSCRKAG